MIARLAALVGGALFAHAASAAPAFVNGLALAGDTGDLFGNRVNDGRVGFFSDLYYDAARGEWWGLSDRGPGGGTLDYDTRVQRFELQVDPVSGAISGFQVLETVKFMRGGAALNGRAPNPVEVLGNAFDPEGFVVSPKNGHFLVSDEYGPSLYEFNRRGHLTRVFATPQNLIPRDGLTGVPNYAADPATQPAGKRSNRGFEGLAVSPDGRHAYAMLQSAMLDEGGSDGRVSRIVKFDLDSGAAVAQYAYVMDTASQGRGTSALVALNEHEFLVLERNNRGIGVGATLAAPDKRVYRIDLRGASDVSGIDLDSGAAFTPVNKSALLLDLDADTLPALGNKSPEKWEGLAIGPRLADGSYLLLAGTDNDYSVTQSGSGTQFDVYFRFTDADPYASSIQCPLGSTLGCFLTSNPAQAATPTANHALLPGVLHAYKAAPQDLARYQRPAGRCLDADKRAGSRCSGQAD
jgi:hypothetical protein